MFLRNLMAMDTEEMIRAQPMDAVVLIGGCDKTLPALLMASASVDRPAIAVVTGPMMTDQYQGERSGSVHRLPTFLGHVPGRERLIDRPLKRSTHVLPPPPVPAW